MTARWLRPLSCGAESSLRLICFPHVGGSASFFLPLARALPDCIHVAAVQYPGRQDRLREPPLIEIAALADGAHEALLAECDVPTALFGHSMGATVAFEVARRLDQTNDACPIALFVSGCRAPALARGCWNRHQRTDAELVAELHRLGGTNWQLLADDAFRRVIVSAARADLTAVETYRHRPKPQLHCPVTALVGASDPLASISDVAAWRSCTTGPFEMHTFPGGHFYLVEHNEGLAERVVVELRKAIARRSDCLPRTPPASKPRATAVPPRPCGLGRNGE